MIGKPQAQLRPDPEADLLKDTQKTSEEEQAKTR